MATELPDSHVGWPARRGHLRASDADRELVVDALKAAFVQGRLGRSELARRAGQALESRTYADLAAATAGIPPHHPAPVPARCPDASEPVNRRRIGWVLVAAIASPGLGIAFFATYYGSFFVLLLLAFVAAGVLGPNERPTPRRHSVH